MSPPSSGSKNKPSKETRMKQVASRVLLPTSFTLVSFNGVPDVLSQKIELLITNAVRTSSLTKKKFILYQLPFYRVFAKK
jgi:hypothetical protein